MIALPWQIVAGLMGLLALQMILQHHKKETCEERLETANHATRRTTMANYREVYQQALIDAREDAARETVTKWSTVWNPEAREDTEQEQPNDPAEPPGLDEPQHQGTK